MRSSNSPSALFRELVDNARDVHAPSNGTRFVSSADFATMNVKQEWLVRNLITRYEPLIIGGPKKCMKTSIQVELAISLAAGINAQFLQKFEVMKPCRVAMISGESGRATLQKVAKTICKAKNLDLACLPIDWCFEMPLLTQRETRERLSAMIREEKIDVMIFDPMYLGLLGENINVNAANVLSMGPMLKKVVDICIPHRCTPILVHHTKKLGKTEAFRPLDLDDLSQAGFAEFARQWLLLSRRSEFADGSGHHELWMRTGGSAGHSATWCVDIDKGSESYNVMTAKWDVRVR